MIFEVCVDSTAGVRAARAAEAARVELCADLLEGGVTPSRGMIQQARAIASTMTTNSRSSDRTLRPSRTKAPTVSSSDY